MPLRTSWLRKLVKIMRDFFIPGEAKLLMVLMLPSTQAVKKYCFQLNNTGQVVAIPYSDSICTLSAKQFPLARLSDELSLTKLYIERKDNEKEKKKKFWEVGTVSGFLSLSFQSTFLPPSFPLFLSSVLVCLSLLTMQIIYTIENKNPQSLIYIYIYSDSVLL